MSVKLILSDKFHLSKYQGAYCFCPHNFHQERPANLAPRPTKLYVDLEVLEKHAGLLPENVITVPINFDVVPVDKKIYYDIYLIHPKQEKIPRRLVFEKQNEAEEKFDDVFRVMFPNANCMTNSNKKLMYIRGRTERDAKFRCFFEPVIPSMLYNDNFIIWADGVPIRFQCRGYSEGPSFCFSQNIISFGGVLSHTENIIEIEIHNHSCCTAQFQLDADNNRSPFKVCPTSGSLGPMSTSTLQIAFMPEKPQCYYKRLICLVHQQCPQFLDVLGICMPNQVEFLNELSSFTIDAEDTQFIPLPSLSATEYFRKRVWGIKFNQDYINFGSCDIYTEDESTKKLIVSSNLPYDLYIDWIEDPSQIFQVRPQQCIVEAMGSREFSMHFLPKFPDSFYSGALECYIYPVGYNWPPEFGPPWICRRGRRKARSSLTTPSNSSSLGKIKKKSKKRKCNIVPTATTTDEGDDNVENQNGKTGKKYYVPMEVRIRRYNDLKEKVRKLKPERKHAVRRENKGKVKSKKTDGIAAPPATAETPSDVPVVVDRKKDSGVNENTIKAQETLPLVERGSGDHHGNQSDSDRKGTKKKGQKKKKAKGKAVKVVSTKKKKKILSKMPIIDIAIPVCRCIHVTGHTFGSLNAPYVSQVEMPRRITMGPTLPKKRICSTTIIKNTSDLPASYNLESLDVKTGFRLKPRVGVIPGKKSQIILASLAPKQSRSAKYTATSLFNLNLQDKFQVELSGLAQIPHLSILLCYESLTKNKGIICPITIPGCCTETYMELINYSRFHYRYMLEVKHPDRDDWQIFSATPAKGFLTPHEHVRIQWKFIPLECRTYKVHWRFRFSVAKSGHDLLAVKNSSYQLMMSLTGVSQFCTLSASTNLLDFDMVRIFDKETRTFTLSNVGNCTARAHLTIFHTQWLADFPKGLVTISPTKVLLAPNESIEVNVTVRPTRADVQNFYIEYQIDLTETNEYGQVLLDAEPERLIDITFMGDHAIFKITDVRMISRHPVWDAEHCWNMFSLSQMNELLVPLRHVARETTIPKIETISFRFPPAPFQSDSAIFTLMLTSIGDVVASAGAGHWEILTESTRKQQNSIIPLNATSTNKKRKSSCFFSGDIRDTAEFIERIWKEKLQDKSKLKRETVTRKKSSPSGQEQRRSTISQPRKSVDSKTDSKKLSTKFTVLPTRGTIGHRENQQITFKYTYSEVGNHKMIALLRVYPAIFVWIEMCGHTLDPYQAYVQYMFKDVMQLHPINLSDLDPPIQMFWMYNGSNVPCQYEVDQKPFEEVKVNNFEHSVMQCLNPTGKVNPKSWYPIKLRFSPLEYVNYKVNLIIKSENHTTTTVSVEGKVSLESGMNLRPMSAGPGLRKTGIINPLVPVTVRPPHVSINHFIPTGTKCTSVVFVTNLSSKHKMSFVWPEVPIEGGGSITFSPSSKLLQPNEEAACMIIVKAGKVSATFSCMIRCEIEDETANAEYEEKLEIYMEGQRTLRNRRFSVKSSSMKKEKVPPKPEKPPNFSCVLDVSVYIGTALGMLDSVPLPEQSRVPFVDSICKTINEDPTGLSSLPFSRHLSQEIISNMLWEIIHAPTFEAFARQSSKRNAPYFHEYKESEGINTENDYVDETETLTTKATSDVLQNTIFNILQEMSNNFSQNENCTWYELKAENLEQGTLHETETQG